VGCFGYQTDPKALLQSIACGFTVIAHRVSRPPVKGSIDDVIFPRSNFPALCSKHARGTVMLTAAAAPALFATLLHKKFHAGLHMIRLMEACRRSPDNPKPLIETEFVVTGHDRNILK
jgi:hypothetical protein